jgi:hypothetical protein
MTSSIANGCEGAERCALTQLKTEVLENACRLIFGLTVLGTSADYKMFPTLWRLELIRCGMYMILDNPIAIAGKERQHALIDDSYM